MKYVIDRFEGEYAIIETGSGMVNIPAILLPDACEGDIIEISVLKEETASEKEEMQNRLNKLFAKGE